MGFGVLVLVGGYFGAWGRCLGCERWVWVSLSWAFIAGGVMLSQMSLSPFLVVALVRVG